MADETLGRVGDSAVVWHQASRDWWLIVFVGTFHECFAMSMEAGDDFNVVRGRVRGEALDVWELLAALPRVSADSGGELFRRF